MGSRIPIATRRRVTNKLRTAYARTSKIERGRWSARRMLTGPVLPDPAEQVDRQLLRAKSYSDESRLLLERVWALMGCPVGKYLTVMLPIWQPLLVDAEDLDRMAEEEQSDVPKLYSPPR